MCEKAMPFRWVLLNSLRLRLVLEDEAQPRKDREKRWRRGIAVAAHQAAQPQDKGSKIFINKLIHIYRIFDLTRETGVGIKPRAWARVWKGEMPKPVSRVKSKTAKVAKIFTEKRQSYEKILLFLRQVDVILSAFASRKCNGDKVLMKHSRSTKLSYAFFNAVGFEPTTTTFVM